MSDDLDKRRQSFRLAVAEAVIVIGRHRRDPHRQQDNQAGDQIEAAVGKRSEHRHRRGLDRGIDFQRDQQDRHGGAGHGGPRCQFRAVGRLRAWCGHG